MPTQKYEITNISTVSGSKTLSWRCQADGNWTNSNAGTNYSWNKYFTSLSPALKNYIKITSCSLSVNYTITGNKINNRSASFYVVDGSNNRYGGSSGASGTCNYTLTASQLDALNAAKPSSLGIEHVASGTIQTPFSNSSSSINTSKSYTHTISSTMSSAYLTITYTSGTCRRWNGSGWEICEVYRYNGTQWESCELYRITSDGKKELCE